MKHDSQTQFRPLSLLAACALPGAGHMVGGDVKRGILVAAGVLGLFFGGILIGGIDVVDSREDRIWFFGEALVGPVAFGVDYLHQHRFKVYDRNTRQWRSANPDEGRDADGTPLPGGTPPNRKSLGKVNELGTLFATIAGMMNLIAIIDAGFPAPRRRDAKAEGAKP